MFQVKIVSLFLRIKLQEKMMFSHVLFEKLCVLGACFTSGRGAASFRGVVFA